MSPVITTLICFVYKVHNFVFDKALNAGPVLKKHVDIGRKTVAPSSGESGVTNVCFLINTFAINNLKIC